MGASAPHAIANIGPRERRRRTLLGVVMFVVAAGLSVWLIRTAAPRVWRLAVLLPLFVGALGVFQARAQTCVALAARGLCNMDGGVEPMDADARGQVQRQARQVNRRAAVTALLVTAALMALP